jgi:hypothetical protein
MLQLDGRVSHLEREHYARAGRDPKRPCAMCKEAFVTREIGRQRCKGDKDYERSGNPGLPVAPTVPGKVLLKSVQMLHYAARPTCRSISVNASRK